MPIATSTKQNSIISENERYSNMKRLCLILLVIFANISVSYSQTSDASRIARTAFLQGDYAEAVNWYKSAINLTDNPQEKANLNQSLLLAQSCAANLKHANILFSRGEYLSAKSAYQKLLSANPSDVYVKQRISRCSQKLRDASDKQRRDAKYKAALQKGDAESIKAFLKLYPNDDARNLLTFMLLDGDQIADSLMNVALSRRQDTWSDEDLIKVFESLFVQSSVSAGDAFFEVGNRGAAKLYYQMAAAYGNAESLYKLALCYDDISKQEPRNLLAISAAGNCSAASEELDKLASRYPKLKYDKKVAKRMYDNLRMCRTNVGSALYVYENIGNYSIDKSIIECYIESNDRIIRELDGMIHGDQLLYQLGLALYKLHKDPMPAMRASAKKGNIAAIKWIADKSKDAEYLRCYKVSQIQGAKYKAYIKYLKGQTMTTDDWFEMNLSYSMSLNKNEELLSLVKSNALTDKYFFKSVKKLLTDNEYWDADIVNELLTFNYTIVPRRVAKLRKILSKVKTRQGMYNKQASPVYRLAEIGCYDNLHVYRQQIAKEALWTSTKDSAVSVKPSYSRTTTTSTPVYYTVGQELEDGYVFFVDSSGQHGKIVSKSISSITPKQAATYIRGANWRFATSRELYTIYKVLNYPLGTYFAKDGQNINNYNAVTFNKKQCYSVNVNWQYTYKLLLVRTF